MRKRCVFAVITMKKKVVALFEQSFPYLIYIPMSMCMRRHYKNISIYECVYAIIQYSLLIYHESYNMLGIIMKEKGSLLEFSSCLYV